MAADNIPGTSVLEDVGLTDEVASLLTVKQTVGQMVDHSVDLSTDLPNETAEEVCSFLVSGSACLLL